jgi:hypothetical protein
MPTGKNTAPPKRDITKIIFLTGLSGEYYIGTGGFAGLDEIPLSHAGVGRALVRTLRDEASKHPELIPEEQPKRGWRR